MSGPHPQTPGDSLIPTDSLASTDSLAPTDPADAPESPPMRPVSGRGLALRFARALTGLLFVPYAFYYAITGVVVTLSALGGLIRGQSSVVVYDIGGDPVTTWSLGLLGLGLLLTAAVVISTLVMLVLNVRIVRWWQLLLAATVALAMASALAAVIGDLSFTAWLLYFGGLPAVALVAIVELAWPLGSQSSP